MPVSSAVISVEMKLATYLLLRMFPSQTGEYNPVAVQIYSILGLELGVVVLFAVSVLCFLGMKKGVDIYPGREKTIILFLAILTIAHACIFIYNLWIFINLLQKG